MWYACHSVHITYVFFSDSHYSCRFLHGEWESCKILAWNGRQSLRLLSVLARSSHFPPEFKASCSFTPVDASAGFIRLVLLVPDSRVPIYALCKATCARICSQRGSLKRTCTLKCQVGRCVFGWFPRYFFWNAFEAKKWRQVETSWDKLCRYASALMAEDCRLGPHVADNRRIGECVGTLVLDSSMILETTDRMVPMISCERGNLASKFNAKVLWPQVDSVALQFFVGRFGTDNSCFPWKNPKHIRQRLVWITCSQVHTAEGDDHGGMWTVYSIVSNDVFRWPCKRHKLSEFECAVWSLQVQHPSLWCVWWTCGVETLAHRRLQSFSCRWWWDVAVTNVKVLSFRSFHPNILKEDLYIISMWEREIQIAMKAWSSFSKPGPRAGCSASVLRTLICSNLMFESA